MLNVIHTLEHMGINAGCYTQAVQQVREQLEKEKHTIAEAVIFIHQVIGVHTTFESVDEALLVCQTVVETAIKNGGDVGNDPEEALTAAKKRVHEFMNKPSNKWMFAKPEGYNTPTITESRSDIIEGIQTQVSVTSEGKFKKGEKERLAIELYQNFQKTDPRAANPKEANQAFIAILVDKLGMSKAGATTYNYNMKKKLGGEITAKPKRAK